MVMWLRFLPVMLLLPAIVLAFFLLRILSDKKHWIESIRERFLTPANYYLIVFGFTAACSIIPSLTRGAFPLPEYHDEFAYFLAADTFAHGRLANSTPLGWVHFESYHINMKPAYCAKYQPGMGLVLAAGQLLGHPYLGVILSLVVASLVWAWMCRHWLPLSWAYLGSLLASMMLISISGDGYFVGGTLATIPTSLLLGMMRIPVRSLRWWHGTLMGLSLVVYFYTRPFEGALATLFLGTAILFRIHRQKCWGHFFRRLLFGSLLAIMPGAYFQAEFNYACTGSYLKLPYLLHEEEYGMTPLFLFQNPRAETLKYHHAELARFHQNVYEWHQLQNASSYYHTAFLYKFETVWHYSLGLLWPVVILMQFKLWKYGRLRMLLLLWISMVFSHVFLTTWILHHYLGPGLPAWGLILVFGVKFYVRDAPPRWHYLVWWLLFACFTQFTIDRIMEFVNKPAWMQQRQQLQTQLQYESGKHLVFIAYPPDHDSSVEWVYNSANIDGQNVVWARSMGADKDRELIKHYPQRKYWLLNIGADASLQLHSYTP